MATHSHLARFSVGCTVSLVLSGGILCGQRPAPGRPSAERPSQRLSEWPEYRGPTADGQAPAAALPKSWREDHNVTFKVPIHGRGWSSPVVGSGRVWMTTATRDGRRMFVVAVDVATGAILFDRQVLTNRKPAPIHRLNSYASPSPVLAPGRVFLHFGTYGTLCLDTSSGETIWQRTDINCRHIAGPGSSPILFDDLLIFSVDGGDVQYVTALDQATGATIWRTDRSIEWGRTPPDLRKAFSTPILIDLDGEPRLVSTGAQAAMAYEPSTGRELWKVRYGRGFSMSARPLFADGVLYLNTGYMRPRLLAVAATGKGDVTRTNVLWKQARSVPTMPSPVLVGQRIYMVSDGGIATCTDIETGKLRWRKRLGGEFSASPIVAGGRIYCFDRQGRTSVIAPGDEFELLTTNQLKDGCMASPAVVGDALLLRTMSHLYRIETRVAAVDREDPSKSR